MTLTDTDVDTFVRDGVVVLRGAVDREVIDDCRSEIWAALPESPDDPATWTEPVRRLDSPWTPSDEVLATGAAGDVFLCHPFLVHAAQVNHIGRPRFLSQPGIMLREQFDLTHPTSPVEQAIVDALP